MVDVAAREQAKYRKAWAQPDYGKFSPGEAFLPAFRQLVRKRGTLVDIGCGAGRASSLLSALGHTVTCLDFVDAREDQSLHFLQRNIWEPWGPMTWDMGYCCDVMEHLPPSKVKLALDQVKVHTRRCFFSICNVEDHFGQGIGETLHLTVKPFEWWLQALEKRGFEVMNARDLLINSLFYVRS